MEALMGKAKRLRAERAAGLRRQPEQNAPRPNAHPQSGMKSRGNRAMRRARGVTRLYEFYDRKATRPARQSAQPWLGTFYRDLRRRNGVSRGAPTRMLRRSDNRTWQGEPEKGSRRAAFRARWTPGAVFRGRLSGKRYVDQDVVSEAQEKS